MATGGGPSDEPKWTVMVFMGAETVGENAPMDDAAKADLAEMQWVGSNAKLNIFVQIHANGTAQRTHVGIRDLHDVPPADRDTVRGHALCRFIEWSLREGQHDPRKPNHCSMLVLWGHAYEFAIGHVQTRSGTIDALDFAELSDVLGRFRERFGNARLDILGFDACDLSTVELACQLRPFTRYLIGSQIGIPIPGWPYDRVLKRLRDPYDRVMGPAEFGSWIVRRFCESYGATRAVSLTLLDLDRAEELFAYTKVLALVLARTMGSVSARDRVRSLFLQSQTAIDKPYVDVADLCLNLARSSGDALVSAAARRLGDFLISPLPRLVGLSESGGGQPFVVEHGRNASQTARLNGVSLYAPHVAPIHDYEAVRHLYENFTFARETEWSRLVHRLSED